MAIVHGRHQDTNKIMDWLNTVAWSALCFVVGCLVGAACRDSDESTDELSGKLDKDALK
ncbi:MAG: hypothetical protein ACRENT_05945 [Thermodesulfobacteriota bacterium]